MKKVAIIDDNKEFLDEISQALISNGYEAKPFLGTKKVVEEIRRIKPDIILLDLKMEEISGFKIAGDLMNDSETAHIPIIAVTGFYTDEAYHLPIKMCGIKKCLLKPVDPAHLISEIEKTIKQKT